MNDIPAPQPSTHSWRFYCSSLEAWDAMYEDCARANKSIECEQYILENNAVGQKFMRLFADKAAQGVRVFVLCDKFGSRSFSGSSLVTLLRRKGGSFRFYNAVFLWDIFMPWRWYPRTHVKTLLIDSAIAYTGGVCLTEYMRGWRDTHIRIAGPVTGQIRNAFDKIRRQVSRENKELFANPPDGAREFLYLQSYPMSSWHVIYDELMRAISRAKQRVYITSPLFAPNRRFRRLLVKTALRGVDVKIMIPEHAEYPLIDWICLSYCWRLLRAGVRVFRYSPSILHSKTMVVDDGWATVGSTNMDILSFFRNREANLIIMNKDAVAELKRHFLDDMSQCTELTLERLYRQPLWKICVGYCARLIRSFI